MSKTFHYGGQAIMEGVMMRGQKSMSMAVRKPNGEISLTTKQISTPLAGRVREIPLLRGIVVLGEAMVLGVQALFHSANVALEEEEEELTGPWMWGVLAFSLIFAVSLFFITPVFLVNTIDRHLESSILSNIVEGLIRIGVFMLYLGLINLVPSIRAVFANHGAEHKVINAYEAGVPLEVESIRKYSTAHLRCGTSFLLAVLVISIVVFALLGDPVLWLRVLSRIALLPVIAALGYEANRFAATYADNRFVHSIFVPGLALQALTTRQPNDAQIEVAIAALNEVLITDGVIEPKQATELDTPVDEVNPS